MLKKHLTDHFLAHPEKLPGSLLKRQIQWVLLSRVVALSILLSITLLLHSPEQTPFIPPENYIALFIAAVYTYTIVSAIILQHLTRGYDIFAFVQICSDIFFTCLLVFFSGGSQSIFIFVFFFPVICSGLLNIPFFRLLLIITCALGYGMILFLEYVGYQPAFFGSYPPPPLQNPLSVLFRFVVPAFTFFLVGFLSSILAERLKKTEAALSETSQSLDRLALLYKQIFDDINTGIITVDNNGSVTSFNRAAEYITGFNAQEILGRRLLDRFPGLEIRHSRNWRPIIDIIRKDEERIPIGYSWAKLNLPDQQGDSLVYTFQDLSQIKKMENQVRQAEKMAGIGQMAAGIAHEFRNPLAAISGAAQMLSQTVETEQNRKLMGIILRESDRLERNITEFLQFSKPALPEKNWFSLSRLVGETVQMLQQGNEAIRRCGVLFDIPDKLECYADADQIRQVFENLLINSSQAFGRERGTIFISAKETSQEQNEEWLAITVSDDGPGIDDKFFSAVFEPFFTTREDGTGLGLAIVWQIIKNHDGRISVENRSQGGAHFSISLPLP